MGEQYSFFPYDYCFSYDNSKRNSKYYLPFLITKLFIISVLNVLLKSHLFYLLVSHVAILLVFLVYLIKTKPFCSKFSNARVITMEVMIILVNLIFGAYQYFAEKKDYR